ncbi:hypothetical protein CR513_24416, partial [Mucuna pruriens]
MKKDFVACYDIESKIFNSRQRTFLIKEYYGTLNGLWIEMKRPDDQSCLIKEAPTQDLPW